MEKILVIDDEKPTLMMFRLTLAAYGFEVLTAENGQEGIDVFTRERPDIILTDIKMPGMDGIEVLKRVKAIDPRVEVIVITGHGDMDLAIQALNLDATDFINKPVQRHLLEQAIRRARERRRLAGAQAAEMVLQPAERAAVIRLEGSLTARSETRLQEIYREALDLKKPVIVLMFSETATVNGAGIALLTQLVLDAQKEGRRMLVAGASDNHKKMFDIVGFSKLVEFVDALEPGMGCGRETGSAPSWRG